MIKFKVQALTKGQMSSVRGGVQASYTTYHPTAENPLDAADQIHAETGAGQVNCVKIS